MIRGAGSILDFCPDITVYDRIVSQRQGLREHWLRVGDHLRYATRIVSGESATQQEETD